MRNLHITKLKGEPCDLCPSNMAFSVDPLSYEVVHELTPRELFGAVHILGKKYDLPKGNFLSYFFFLSSLFVPCLIPTRLKCTGKRPKEW